MSFVGIAVGTSIAGAGYKIFDSVKKDKQADKIAAANQRPVYDHPEEIDQVYDVAASEVNNTLEEDLATQQLQLNASDSIDAILKSGGRADFGVINGTYGNQLRAMIASLAAKRDARIAAYNTAAYNKAKAKDAEFSYNEDAPFKDAKEQEALLRQQGEQSKMAGINGIIGVASDLATGNLKPGQYGTQAPPPSVGPELRAPAPTIAAPVTIPTATPDANDHYYDESANGWRINGGNNVIAGFDEFGQPIYKRR